MNKSVLKSKTFWFGLLTVLSPLIPAVEAVVANNPAQISMVWGTLAIILRVVTKDKVVLVD